MHSLHKKANSPHTAQTRCLMAATDRLLDVEDVRLTAGERRFLRQIALRLQNGEPPQRMVEKSPACRGQQVDLEEAIAALFSGGK